MIVMVVIYDSDDDGDGGEQRQRAMTCCGVFGILVSAELSTLETGSAVDSKRRKINDDHDDDNHNHVSMLQLGQISNKYATVVGFEAYVGNISQFDDDDNITNTGVSAMDSTPRHHLLITGNVRKSAPSF